LISTVTQGVTDALKTTVRDSLKNPSAIVAESGEPDFGFKVPGADNLLNIITGPSTQVASTDSDMALAAIDDLLKNQTEGSLEDELLQLSSPEVGEGEQAAINELIKQPETIVIPDEEGNQFVIDQDGNVVDIIPAEQAPIEDIVQPPALDQITDVATEPEAEPVAEPEVKTPEVIVIPDESGNQLVINQDGNVVDIIPPETDIEEPVEPSLPEATVTEEPEEEKPPFQGPMGPMTEDQTKRYSDEFAKSLDSLTGGETPPPDYGVQDLGITDENLQSFNENLKEMTDEGRLPSQWQADEEGNYTYVADDGSTLTIGPDGEIVHYTEAPQGNLPGETPAPAPAPAPAPPAKITTAPPSAAPPPSSAPAPSRAPAPAAQSGLDVNALMALLGAMGGSQAAPSAPAPEYSKMPEFDVMKAFAPTLYQQRAEDDQHYLSGLTKKD
jgi:hypothetical protein